MVAAECLCPPTSKGESDMANIGTTGRAKADFNFMADLAKHTGHLNVIQDEKVIDKSVGVFHVNL